MNIRLLRIFKLVCETGNITKTAELLYMTQPAVSLAIKELEAETGLVLFDRPGRRLEITDSGKLYLEKVYQLLELCDELEQSPAEIKKQVALRIGCCITIACSWLPDIVTAFRSIAPDKPLQLIVCSAAQVMSLLQDNKIDLALYEGIAPGSIWTSTPISRYKLIPVCSPEHSFAQKKSVGLDTLMDEPLLLRESGSAIRDTFDSFLRLNHRIAQPVMTSTNTQALIAAAANNLGVSILPDVSIAYAVSKNMLHPFTVEEMQLVNQNSVICHQNKVLTAAMKTFIECAGQIVPPAL